jgi:hypothetical protein
MIPLTDWAMQCVHQRTASQLATVTLSTAQKKAALNFFKTACRVKEQRTLLKIQLFHQFPVPKTKPSCLIGKRWLQNGLGKGGHCMLTKPEHSKQYKYNYPAKLQQRRNTRFKIR